ncbi:metallophosphoesterase family protein [Agriterribacter sp.]|uniref:metallophosphoesterase family protein n=1 Tax=Agriterribacter sp. TaxID=2821509 RepID=UPI002B597B0A|nr:metallophosphoesterase family protein [Agriterribacter sp.]HTN05410.1 metallophosphoesterase family protein [Agriterribacter sp.]
MKRIGILSDTHSYLDEGIFVHFEHCDEIWHAGDFGGNAVADSLKAFKPLRGVYGNIDGKEIRGIYPEKLHFTIEQVNVFMQHIGGYPGRYAPGVKNEIIHAGSALFISGHSHILKIIYDDQVNCLHINPGAAGRQGWQKVRTIVRLTIDGNNMKDCEVIELGKK